MIEIGNKCTGCGACCEVCPKGAIKIVEINGFLYPLIDKSMCVNCNLCENVCPQNKKYNGNIKVAYYGNSKDLEIIKKSSSGGVFFELCKYVIKNHGVVVAPGMKKDLLERIIYDKIEDIYKFALGSKYFQCEPFLKYKEIKSKLDDGILVLYSGTPCQIVALKSYLKKEYTNLITQDIICHGVASPTVFRKYLKSIAKKQNVSKVSFRDKSKGWNLFSMSIDYGKNKKYKKLHTKDSFFYLFLRNKILRESCYNCEFKSTNRASDITLGDFWGYTKVTKKDNDTGVSLILVNTEKGKNIIDKLEIDKETLSGEQLKEALLMNTAYDSSVKKPKNYERDMKKLLNSKEFILTVYNIKVKEISEKIRRKLGRK